MAKKYLDQTGLSYFWSKVDELKADQTDLDALEGRVDQAETDISDVAGKVTTLIGDDANKSVRTIANEELAKQLIAEGAQESLDTLAEIAQWIQDHPDDAAAMNEAIAALQAKVDTGDKTVTIYVTDAINALKIGDYALAADLTTLAARVDALEKAGYATTSDVDTALTDAKTYTDEEIKTLDESIIALTTAEIDTACGWTATA